MWLLVRIPSGTRHAGAASVPFHRLDRHLYMRGGVTRSIVRECLRVHIVLDALCFILCRRPRTRLARASLYDPQPAQRAR